MSEYMFGAGRGQLPALEVRRRRAAAKRHGCCFIHVRLPEGWRYWFAGPNRGEPFDRDLAAAVLAELDTP